MLCCLTLSDILTELLIYNPVILSALNLQVLHNLFQRAPLQEFKVTFRVSDRIRDRVPIKAAEVNGPLQDCPNNDISIR